MKLKTAVKLLVLITAVISTLPLLFALPKSGLAAASAPDPTDIVAQVANYKKWKLVNPTPVKMDAVVAAACAQAVSAAPKNPHFNKFISVYVNPTGEAAMLTRDDPKFPAGSIVIKEKLAAADSPAPELLTVMVKHDKGYNAASGDWEYLVMDGAATKMIPQANSDSCNACHTAYASSDYLIRSYVKW